MKHLLELRILLPLSVFVAVVFSIGFSLIMSTAQSSQTLHSQSLEYVRQNIATLSHLAERTIQTDSQIIEDSITQLSTNPLIEAVAIIKPDGEILYGTDFSWRGEKAVEVLPHFSRENLHQAQQSRRAIILNVEDGQAYMAMMSYSHPSNTTSLRNVNKGVVFLCYNISETLTQSRITAIYQRIPEVIALLFLALLLTELLRRYVVLPIESIKSATHDIADGKFDSTITPTGPKEIKELTRTFNAMHDKLSTTISALDSRTQQIQGILDNAFDGIITIDTEGTILSFNRTAEELFKVDADEVIGQNVKTLMPDQYKIHHDQYIGNYLDTGDAKIIGTGREVQGQRKDGSIFPMELAVTEVSSAGQRTFIGIVRDITERKDKENEVARIQQSLAEANERLEELVRTDSLTGISNRRSFDEVLATEFNRAIRQKHPISLLMFDVDFFKKYNDHYGHVEGDQCLIKIAQAANNLFRRSGELVTRYGGEEFAVILPNTSIEDAQRSATLLLERIANLKIEHVESTSSNYVSISIGAASMTPSIQQSVKDLISESDTALYNAKGNGRNQVATN